MQLLYSINCNDGMFRNYSEYLIMFCYTFAIVLAFCQKE